VVGIVAILVCLLGLPWLIFHYVTKWKSQAVLTGEDEKLLDELHDIARRLDDRLCTVERIMTAENPNWRSVACDPATLGLDKEPDALDERSIGGRTVSNRPLRSL
jgi:phage shock protein B